MQNRREFLQNAGIISLGFTGLQNLFRDFPKDSVPVGYGPLLRKEQSILELPEGFTYKILTQKGKLMSDGFYQPGMSDGMAAFEKNGKVILVRNHEISPGDMEEGPYGKNAELLDKIDKDLLYDFGYGKNISLGGTTNLVFNEETMEVEKDFISLTGTVRNCAGGPTPWGTWITCEETYVKANSILEKDHGYNFEVDATDELGVQKPVPLKAMGRFVHEAVAVDPHTGIVYQTHDDSYGLIYRFVPDTYGDLSSGKLQALAIVGEPSCDTRNWKDTGAPPIEKNKKYEVEWIDLDDIEAPDSDLHKRGFEQGAAMFARGEGMWYGDGEIYFACTNGGPKGYGQIFRYVIGKNEGKPNEASSPGQLELFIESHDSDLMQSADNLTIAPWGDVIVAEDQKTPRLVGVTPEGELYHIAKSIAYESEFAGVCFSPSGKTLFVNIQVPGITLAIQGPWHGNKKIE